MSKIKPIVTEKAVMKIETENVITFEIDMKMNKEELRKELKEVFEIDVEGVRTLVKKGKKYAYVKLNKKSPAIDLATKLGLM